MKHVPSPLAAHYNPARMAIYTQILTAPATDWTVASLASSLAVTQDSVRATLYVLLTDGLMTQVPGHRTLTLQLTADGQRELTSLVSTWRRANTKPSNQRGHRNSRS